jgi:hypothetical protein
MQLQLFISNTHPQLQGERRGSLADTKTGPKVSKQLYGETLGHNVSVLMGGGRYMQHQSHLLTNEVDIDLNIFRATVMDRIGRHVNHANIVIVDNSSCGEGNMELLKQPTTLSHNMCNCPILSSALERETVVWSLEDQDTRFTQ